jgi:hypothetical protein
LLPLLLGAELRTQQGALQAPGVHSQSQQAQPLALPGGLLLLLLVLLLPLQ